MLLLTEICEHTKRQNEIKQTQYGRFDYHYNPPNRYPTSYQSMMFGRNKITLNANHIDIHDLIKELQKAQGNKQTQPRQSYFEKLYVDTVRLGSHKEVETWVSEYDKKKHTTTRIVEDSKTVYYDSLVSKEWLEQHIKDEYPEPIIEITVDNDDKTLHLNGNYKKGLIGEFLNQYTTKVRIGRKLVTISA